MAQRFNAPPGWNVPPDFVPTSDWQPDPSWPPAPEGWNYWVDDAAQPAPAYGAPSDQSYGTPGNQPHGSPADQGTTPYGSASVPNSPYTAPAGAYGSTAPGSAHAALAQHQGASGKRNMLIGIGVFVVAIVVWVVSYSAAGPGDRYFAPWYFVLIGIILTIRGLVDMNKAKKAEAAQLGYGQGSAPPGFTPPGTTPPGQNPPGF
ncbi:hypothetical protein [Pseudactinotalea terrae]|uniref:hypothetical protein n=1 Tax=Pseudactinotalea terrae TaxID=1743262 RepID=UPI0012E0DFF6|nr:hypothetical protein [Pseudactinotalea terrae]